MIELKHVSKEFAARGVRVLALDTIDLSVAPEEFVALVGPSGCGKSTVLNLVSGLLRPTHGEVWYEGALVNGPNRRVGYMTRKIRCSPGARSRTNIGIALEPGSNAPARYPTPSGATDVHAMMDLVGLSGFARHYPAELSGGMRKRAALARMLIYEPETFLLDEPFGALDAQLKLIMHQELLRLTRARKLTVVFVTHDLAEAITLADRVLVFTGRPGRIRAERKIPFGRERDAVRLRFLPEFGALHEELWNELKDEVVKGTEA